MKADVDIHPELEDKIEVGHEFSWVDEPRSGQCRISISVRNATQDYVISATANSDTLDRGFTNLEPGRSDSKEIERSCTEDIERYLVRIGMEDYEIEENELVNDHNEEIDIEGEVILGERAEEHLNVLDHALVWRNAEEEHCEVRVELEKTSPEKYIIDDTVRTNVYDDDGERITGVLGPSLDSKNLKEGESRVFSTSIDGGYEELEEATEYEVSFNHLNVSVPVDELEPDFDLNSELEGKLKVIDSSISFDGGILTTLRSTIVNTPISTQLWKTSLKTIDSLLQGHPESIARKRSISNRAKRLVLRSQGGNTRSL